MTAWERSFQFAQRLLEWHLSIRSVDQYVTRLYGGGVRVLYTWPAQIALALLAVSGIVAFVVTAVQAMATVPSGGVGLLWFLLPAIVFSVLIHEAGHAFTTKAFGHDVPRAGVGWYWFAPMAFVDTSDMWLADRWPRIAVSLAGPYTNLLLGSLSALAAWLIPFPALAVALWHFAFVSYSIVLFNLNPLLEFDGYYVLIDLLDRPNLRQQALAWLGAYLPIAIRRPALLRSHTVEILYGTGSLLYVVIIAVFTVVSYRVFVQAWMAGVLPGVMAAGLAWVLAASVVGLYAVVLVGELRGVRTIKPSSLNHEMAPSP